VQATGDVIAMQGVGVVRDGATLLDYVDWAVDQDQRWVVLGPNGAGKTTLLRIPAREKVRDVVLTASYGMVGRWRERYDIHDEVRADQVLKQVGCAHLADRTYGTLSEGERKRAQIARALMTDPEMLLLDEPAAGLDLGGREDLVARLASIAADPDAPTTVLVTHHVEEIPVGFTHALLLRGGQVVAAGPLHESMTEQSLSDTFGIGLRLNYRDGRFAARAV
jgi:iron complex transport system ATP-binding protein